MKSQRFDIPFGYGLNQDAAKMVVEPPYLTVAQNVELPKAGGCYKRSGYDALTLGKKAGVNVASCLGLASHRGALLTLDSQSVLQYDPTGAVFSYTNAAPEGLFCTAKSTPLVSDLANSGITAASSAYVNGYLAVTWSTADTTTAATATWYRIVEYSSGAIVATGQLSNAGYGVKVIVIGNYFVFFWVQGGAIYSRHLSTTTAPIAISAGTTTTASDANAGFCSFDACPLSATQGMIAYCTNGPTLKYGFVDFTGSLGSSATFAINPTIDLTVCSTTGETGYVAYVNGSGLSIFAFNPVTLASTGATLVDAAAAGSVFVARATSTSAELVWSGNPSGVSSQGLTRFTKVSNVGVAAATKTIVGGYPVSRPFASGGALFCQIKHYSPLQGSIFTVQLVDDTSGGASPAVAVHFPTTGGSYGIKSDPAQIGATEFVTAMVYQVSFPDALSNSLLGSGVGLCEVNFGKPFGATEYGYSTYLAGGIPLVYDGVATVEDGFHWGPELNEAFVTRVAGGGSLSAGTYQYRWIYEHTLDTGEVIYSTTSTPFSVTVSLNDSVTVSVPHLGLTRKGKVGSGTSRARIMTYRSQVNSRGPFFRLATAVTNVPGQLANSTWLDTASDVTISTASNLYTDGGALDDQQPPPSSVIAAHQDRLFLATGKDIYYSKEYVPGEAARFNAGNVFRCEQDEDIVAMRGLDNSLVVFKHSSIFACDGVGFDDTGNGQNFTARRIASDVGCIDSRSVVQMPTGLMFQAVPGIYHLDRAGQVTFIGAPIRDLLASYPVCTSATLFPAKNQVRFTLTNSAGTIGTIAVYDYLRQQWLEHTVEANAPIVSSVVVGDAFYYAKADGNVRKGNASSYVDVGSQYSMSIETAWLKPTGLQGFYRARKVHYLGDYLSSHGITIQVAYNGDDIYLDARSWTDAELTVLPREQLAVHLSYQKCSSLKVRVEDTGASGQSYNMQGIALEWVPKQGSTKLVSGAVK